MKSCSRGNSRDAGWCCPQPLEAYSSPWGVPNTLVEGANVQLERIVNAEALASGAPKKPEITTLDRYSLVANDPGATKRVGDAFRKYFPAARVQETKPTTASEDFGNFGTAWGAPSVFWFVGGTDSETYAKAKEHGKLGEIPTNHNPRFAPVIHPSLETGVEAMVVAAQAWLST